MSKLNLNTTVNHAELRNMIKMLGVTNTLLVVSEPGVGKSSMLKELASELPGHVPVYIDAPVIDIPDIMMPMVDAQTKTTHFAMNAQWHLNDGKPLIVMIDELLKASGPTKLILTRLLLERTLGDVPLPEGSIVFATSNNAADGVGDTMAAHLQNRVGVVHLRKPTAEEWLNNFAYSNNIAPEICAWVRQFPQALQSYTDFGGSVVDNQYIFDPKKARNNAAFVTPRSLAKASHIVNARGRLGANATLSALIGTIGGSAAKDMEAYIAVADKLPAYDMVVLDPTRTQVPENDAAASLVLTFSLALRVKEDDINKVVQYVGRMQKEYQMLFMRSLTAQKLKAWSTSARVVTQWHLDNKDLLVSDIDD